MLGKGIPCLGSLAKEKLPDEKSKRAYMSVVLLVVVLEWSFVGFTCYKTLHGARLAQDNLFLAQAWRKLVT